MTNIFKKIKEFFSDKQYTLKESLSIQYDYYNKYGDIFVIDLHTNEDPNEIVSCLKELNIREFSIPRFHIKPKSNPVWDLVYNAEHPGCSIFDYTCIWGPEGKSYVGKKEAEEAIEMVREKTAYMDSDEAEETIRKFINAGAEYQGIKITEAFSYGEIDVVTFRIS